MKQRFWSAVAGLVTGNNVQAKDGYGYYANENGKKHDSDDPGSAVCGTGRRLGDAHGVDEGVGEEEEKLHACSMKIRLNSSRTGV